MFCYESQYLPQANPAQSHQVRGYHSYSRERTSLPTSYPMVLNLVPTLYMLIANLQVNLVLRSASWNATLELTTYQICGRGIWLAMASAFFQF